MSAQSCSSCGYSNSTAGSRYCANCGVALPAQTGTITEINVTQKIEENTGTVTGVQIGKLVGTVIFGSDDAVRARERRNLRVLLDKVKTFWVEGVLKASLKGNEPLRLGKRLAMEAVAPPLQELASLPPPELAPETTVEDAFIVLDRAVLIMDGVGSGKTTSLLQIAGAAVSRAERDPEQPVPVVLNLASWAQNRMSLAEWVKDELALRYQIPLEMGEKWLSEQRLALLLDGLDEVGPDHIRACIEAINLFRKENGQVGLGVCVRSEDYESARIRLKLAGAFELQALSGEQIEEYLESTGQQDSALGVLIEQDEDLRLLASSPLWLQVMHQAFDGQPVDILNQERFDTGEERRSFILDRYLERVFQAAPNGNIFPKNELLKFMTWLARGMKEHGQAIFMLEQIQPAWLKGRVLQGMYWFGTRLLTGLLIGLVLASTAELGGTTTGRIAYLLAASMAGIFAGGWAWLFASKIEPGGLTGKVVWLSFNTLFPAGIFWILFTRWLQLGGDGWRLAAGAGMIFGILFGTRSPSGISSDIRPVEAISWSIRHALKGILPGLGLFAASVAVIAVLYAGNNSLVVWLRFGLVIGLIAWFAVVLISGLQGRMVEQRSYPNQGAWLSWRNALRAGLILGSITGLGYGVSGYGLAAGGVMGLRFGILAGLWYGARDGIQIGVLRLLLTLAGHLPWNAVSWLNHATRLGLLQKVGGGYRFSSRLLQEYLAHGK